MEYGDTNEQMKLRLEVFYDKKSNKTCAWTPNNVFRQRLLWKSVLCKFKWRLRGVDTPPVNTSNPEFQAIGSWA